MSMPQKIKCTVMGIVDHGGHVYSLELKPDRPVPQFLAGQFMHLAVSAYEPGDFWPESRVFSIANASNKHDCLQITYAVVGNFTKFMEQNIHIGKEVWVKLPYGDFIIQSKCDIVLIAGGTGITAFTAFLEGMKPEQGQSVSLFYGARTQELLIFKPLVEQKIKEVKEFSAWYFVEDGEHTENERIISGKLSVKSILPFVSNILNTDYYLSGPPSMLERLRLDLKTELIAPEHIKIDAWE